MSNQRYSPEFKDEAVHQVVVRGHSVAKISDRLGVSAHSLYKWVAVAESFFSSLKKEQIKKRIYKTRDLARADIFNYIEMFYNPTRRHSHIGGASPEAFERASK